MEFKSIKIAGFLSYYNEVEFKFSNGTTVIVGLNSSGKSKLFDAFNWTLFERIWNSQNRKWVEGTNNLSELVLNNKLKKEAIKQKERVSASVEIVLVSEEYKDKTIYIEREYSYDFSKEKPSLVTSLNFSWQDDFTGQSDSVSGASAVNAIEGICPSCLRDFILFQGESASDILKLSQKRQSTIENAIRHIARLKLFEDATEIASSYAKSKINTITKATASSKDAEIKKKQLNSKKENLERKKDKAVQDLSNLNDKIDQLQDIVAEAKLELTKQDEFLELLKNKEEAEKNYKEVGLQLAKLKNVNKEINDTWVFYKVLDKIESFSTFYGKLESKGQVPPSISQAEIKKSLKNHCCSLCGSPLEDGSEARARVEEKVLNDIIDSLGRTLSNLNSTFNRKYGEIAMVSQSIDRYMDEKKNQEEQRAYFERKKEEFDEQIKSADFSGANAKKKQELEILKNLYYKNSKALTELRREVIRCEANVDLTDNEIREIEKQMMDIVSTTANVSVEDKMKVYYSQKLESCMKRLCKAAQELAYQEIQSTANEYYHDMVKENPAIVGDVIIDKINSEIYPVDSYGYRINNLNTGNRIAMQLAVIAGILSVAAEQFCSFYPFVTDAPTSELDGKNKMQTIKCMVRAFEQSIIIVKDDSTDQGVDPIYDLVKNSNDIGAAYQLSLYHEEGADIDDQYTVVSVLKEVDE